MSKLFTLLFTVWLLLLSQVPPSHALDLFLLIDGIHGESRDQSHLGWTQLTNASWTHGEVPPGSHARVQFQPFRIDKSYDSTSAALAHAAATGQPFREVKLEMLSAFGDGIRVVVSRVKLTGVRVAQYAAAVRGSGDFGNEGISFSFDTITWINFKVSSTGQQAPGTAGCWDLVGNKPCPVSF